MLEIRLMRRASWLAALALPLALLLPSCNDSKGAVTAQSFAGSIASRWFALQLELIKSSPGLSPPVASRGLGYAGVALYEAIVDGMPSHQSLAGKLNELVSTPRTDPTQAWHWGAVANAALADTLRFLFAHASSGSLAQIDTLESTIANEFAATTAAATLTRSSAHGKSVAAAIKAWADIDGGKFGHLTNQSPGFTPPVGPGLWVPTPPNFAPALQATWGNNRPFCLASGASCQPGPHPAYSTDPASAFFAEANEVYQTTANLSAEQTAIANFWADNAGQTATPPGHWFSVVNQIAARDGIKLDLLAEVYCKVGIAVADSFISCWYSKFDQNLMRPITYIQANIDANWVSPIPTPPFPEYTSGHSVQSGAVAEILTQTFGDGFAFTDDTHSSLGYPARSFPSFHAAAQEAAISRLYGGIHYRAAIDNGIEQGKAIGREVGALPFRKADAAKPTGPATATFDSSIARSWFDLALTLARTTPGFSPPVASRAFAYQGVALWETVRFGITGARSLAGQLEELTVLPRPLAGKAYHWGAAANAVLARMQRLLHPKTSAGNKTAIDDLEAQLASSFTGQASAETLARSVAFGVEVANAVYFWSRNDRGHEGFDRNFPSSYSPPVGPGLWVPTPPGNQSALQPYWGENRTFALDTSDVCDPGAPPPYSTVNTSLFWQEANEVFVTTNALTQAQTDIALWWADNPGQTATPPGHSISLLTQVLAEKGARLDVAADAYARVGIAVADAFIACWKAKFTYNLLRPITYIQANLDPNWVSPITTPPFPEYTSGHSVQSGAWAEVMTGLFGDRYGFTDSTNTFLGYSARSFQSFYDAANEAAISRLYGGIHFRSAIDLGVLQGRCVGRQVLALKLRD